MRYMCQVEIGQQKYATEERYIRYISIESDKRKRHERTNIII
jgi:hypothetical protein